MSKKLNKCPKKWNKHNHPFVVITTEKTLKDIIEMFGEDSFVDIAREDCKCGKK
jgi:hypothetical protein